MFQIETPLRKLFKLFQWVVAISLTTTFVGCGEGNKAEVVKRRQNQNKNRQVNPSDILRRSTDSGGAFAAGYVGIGLVSLKSINRVIDIALNKNSSSRKEPCQNLDVQTQPDGSVKITILTSTARCSKWTASETITAKIINNKITALARSEETPIHMTEGNASGLVRQFDLREIYSLSEVSAAVLKYEYSGTIDFVSGIPTQQPEDRRQKTPQAKTPAATTQAHSSVIKSTGVIDLSNVSKPKVTMNSLSVTTQYIQNNTPMFNSELTLQEPMGPVLMTCGVPNGEIKVSQIFTDVTTTAVIADANAPSGNSTLPNDTSGSTETADGISSSAGDAVTAADSAGQKSRNFSLKISMNSKTVNDFGLPDCANNIGGFTELQTLVNAASDYIVRGSAASAMADEGYIAATSSSKSVKGNRKTKTH